MKKLLLGLVAVVIILVGIAFILPAEYRVERHQEIKATPSQIFGQLNTLENWKQWMTWIRRDPQMKLTFSGPASGVDASMAWVSETQGSGTLTISESNADASITYTLSFPGYPPSTGRLIITPGAGGQSVSWSDEGNLGNNPVSRYIGLFLDGMIGPDFQEGLNNLKQVCESLPAPEVEAAEEESAMESPADGEPAETPAEGEQQ